MAAFLKSEDYREVLVQISVSLAQLGLFENFLAESFPVMKDVFSRAVGFRRAEVGTKRLIFKLGKFADTLSRVEF